MIDITIIYIYIFIHVYYIYVYIYIYTYNILATNQEDWKSIKWLETDKIQELSAGNRGSQQSDEVIQLSVHLMDPSYGNINEHLRSGKMTSE